MSLDPGSEGADASSSLRSSSARRHRQLECSTGTTEGVSDHTAMPPRTHPAPSQSTCYPAEHLPPSCSELTGQLRQMARICSAAKTQQVLRCQRPLRTSTLSLSRTPAPTPAAPHPPSSARAGLPRLERKGGSPPGLLCYQHVPALK